MFNKIFIALGIAILLFIVYLIVKVYNPSWFDADTFSSKEMPGEAAWIQQQPPAGPPRTISPGGPGTPNMRAIPEQAEVEPPVVTPSDPFEEGVGSSDVKDNLRQPERMFSPGIQPIDTSSSVMSGVASNETQVTSQALQTFVPEMAQNGGEFMKGIAANDTFGDTEFASF